MSNNQEKLNEQLVRAIFEEDVSLEVRLKKIKYLIYLGADVFTLENGKSLLKIVRENGQSEVEKILLDRMQEEFLEIVKSEYGEEAIFGICKMKNKGMDANLVKKAQLGQDLIPALKKGEQSLALDLILKGADVNYRDRDGMTPLLWAARFDYVDIMKLLLDRGAYVNSKLRGLGGESVLMEAITYSKNMEMVEMLVQRGADVNYTTSESYNALLRACRVGSFEIAKYLVDNGADVFHKGEHDTSCLMLAAEYGDEKLVNFLIDKGCNVCERDYWGHNALDNAKKNGNRMVFRIIENKMIEENKKEKVQEKGGFLGKIFGGFGR